MILAALFSGGKDSTFSIYQAQLDGHQIKCLVTILPKSDDSHLLHYSNIELSQLQSRAMGIPQLSVKANSYDTETEVSKLEEVLESAKTKFGIDGIVHGGIMSNFQKEQFENIASRLGLQVIAPIWHNGTFDYLKRLIDQGFNFIITSVSADGLDESWLGRLADLDDLNELARLSSKHGFNINFEGGEAETFVINCPLFKSSISIKKSKKIWDGYRGRFEILEAELENNVR